MSHMLSSRVQALALTGALLVPVSGAFAMEQTSTPAHRHGALKGAAVGAVVARHHRVRGAVAGAAVGAAIQHHRNRQSYPPRPASSGRTR
jgi:hypothetical protein